MIVVMWACGTSGASAETPLGKRARTLTYDPQKQRWIEPTRPLPGTPDSKLGRIRELIEGRDYRRALRQAKRLMKTEGTESAVHPQLLIRRAEAWIGLKEYERAHESLKELLDNYGDMKLTDEALRMEFVVAEAFLMGAKRKVLGIPVLSGRDLGYVILDRISSEFVQHPLAEAAIKAKADHLFAAGDHGLAELEYARLLREFPQSRYHQPALRRSAESSLAGFAGVEYDATDLLDARERFREYRSRYPADAEREGVGQILDGIGEMLAEKDFRVGRYYERTRHFNSAVFVYRMTRADWPESIAAGKAARRLRLLGVPAETSRSDGGQGAGGPTEGGRVVPTKP